MWIAFNNSFLSIVKNRDNNSELLVRARVKGDIENIFPSANVFEDELADYRYRAFIDKRLVSEEISTNLLNIDYDNFKNSVDWSDQKRKQAYSRVWSALLELQR